MTGDNSMSLIRREQMEVASLISPPNIVARTGAAGGFAWDEYFGGRIRNAYTRRAYLFAVKRFLAWSEAHSLELEQITPGMVGKYFDEHPGSIPSKKLHMAAIRGLFDVLVHRHVIILNPALSVRTERYAAVEGRTPPVTVEQARGLLSSIELKAAVDYRDRAIIAMLIYTAVRVGAIARLRHRDLVDEGRQFSMRFAEKGGKARTIPLRHDLQGYVQEYCSVVCSDFAVKDAPLFRSAAGRSGRLTEHPLSSIDICRMVKRRLKLAKLPTSISPHSFRSCTATDLLTQGMPLDDVQYLLGHADARTTRLYDRRQKHVTRNIVERISV